MKQLKIWYLYTKYSFQLILNNRATALIFLTGKTIRIGLFIIFLLFLFQDADSLAGYNRNQIIFFYLSFNLIDTLAQFFFREVYRFRPLLISGDFDLVLIKPINPLIRILLGGADILDLIMVILITTLLIWFGSTTITTNPLNWTIYFLLIFNGLIISASLHILVLAIGITTTTIDHLIMIYRDLNSMMRIPADIYIQPIRAILTFIIPLGIIFTFPPKALMNILHPLLLALSIIIALITLVLSNLIWKKSLRHYTSASS